MGAGSVKRANHDLKDRGGGTSTSKGTIVSEGCRTLNSHFLGLRDAFTPTERDHLSVASNGWSNW